LLTGASDDDPSGIATYSQAGAQFGYGLSWSMLLTFPLMAVTQEISGRIGRVTGHGIAGVISRYYPRWLLQLMVGLLLIANTINLSADLGAMGDALKLLIGGPGLLYTLMFGILCVVLQVYTRYGRYVRLLKWTTLSLFAYFGTALMVKVPWHRAIDGLLIPHLSSNREFVTTLVAVLGTTISPYLFFWQSSQEAEDVRERPAREPLVAAPEQGPQAFERIRIDTYIGMALSNLVGLAIIVTTAATLNANGITNVDTSAKAAEALRPVAGPLAFAVFALGIIGTGLLAVPVLAGSAAYAIGEARRWPVGLARLPLEAKAFYLTLSIATIVGALLNFAPIDAIQALYWSAVVNGVIVVPVMAIMMKIAGESRIMRTFTVPRPLRTVGWLATLLMGLSVVALIVTQLA
jgi:NRAMP (natural resistance-associated macrophage protein)-like metal ion transporter